MQDTESKSQRTDERRSIFSFCSRRSAFNMFCRGQAMTEYVVIAGLLMAALLIMTIFFVTFREYGGRIFALVSSEFP